jgi:hypothetical protein
VQTRGLNRNRHPELNAIFKGAATTVIQQMASHPLHQDFQRMTDAGIKPNLAKLTLARRIAAATLAMWKHQEDYDPKKRDAFRHRSDPGPARPTPAQGAPVHGVVPQFRGTASTADLATPSRGEGPTIRLCALGAPTEAMAHEAHQEIDALSLRDIRIDFNSPLASAARITGNPVSPLVTTASTRVVRHDAPNGPGDLTTRPPDGGRSSGTDACALDIFPSRRSALCNEPNG